MQAPAGNRSGLRRPVDLSTFNLLLLCGLAFWSICDLGVGRRIGDGAEYYLTLFSVAENGTPYPTDRAGAIHDAYFGFDDGANPVSYEAIKEGLWVLRDADGGMDCCHFWFYSSLAAVFYWPLKWLGLDVGLSFNLLHVVLLFVAVQIAGRRLGPLAALSLILMVLFSPVLWFIDKAHTEFFTVMTTSTAMVYFLARRYAACAAWFAAASPQNPPFAILSLVALGFGFFEQRWQLVSRHKLTLAAAVVLMGLHPAYFMLRHGILTPSLLARREEFFGSLLPIGRMASFWVDPDLGMFANWVFALPILVVLLVLCCLGKVRVQPRAVVFGVLCLLILDWSQTRGQNINCGGTVHICRYCLWFLFLFFAMLWCILGWLAGKPRWVIGVWAALAFVPAVYTLQQYHPARPERFCLPTAVSRFLYEHVPSVYDPQHEIFFERYGHLEDFREWAVSDPSGNKILVWDIVLDFEEDEVPPFVVGCPRLDPAAVLAEARKRFAQHPGEYYLYINGMASKLKRPAE
ncbi:MAG: hypothetical protein JXB62_23165 [Pirellulales bacterium]|nr:hypothetical protein [Pirellulales bacterium]